MLTRSSHPNWEFDGFKVLTEARLFLGHGTPIPLTSKAFDTLVLLIANRDRVVTKDDLIASIWEGRAVSDSALTTRINAARVVVGDSGEAQRLIKTLLRIQSPNTDRHHHERHASQSVPHRPLLAGTARVPAKAKVGFCGSRNP